MAKVLNRDGKWLVFSDDGLEVGRHDAEDDARAQAKSIDATVARRTDSKGANVQYRNDYLSEAQAAEHSIRLDRTERTPQGGLRYDGAFQRAGFLKYTREDGTEKTEFRPLAEVVKSLPSMTDAPLTEGHPVRFVDAESWRGTAIGHVAGTPTMTGALATGRGVVSHGDAVAKVGSVLSEHSIGFTTIVEETPGEFEGRKYDAIQRAISVNHVALLPKGHARGGPELRIHQDTKETIDMDELKKLTDALAARDAEVAALKAKADDAEAARVKAEEALKGAPTDLAKAVQDEIAFRSDLAAVLSPEAIKGLDGKSRAELETAAILAVFPGQKVDDASRPAVFALAAAQARKAGASLSQRGTGGGGPAVPVLDDLTRKNRRFESYGRKV